MDVMTWLTDSADQIPEGLRWLVAGAFAALEVLGLGPFFPGEIAVLVLGATFDDVLSAVVLIVAVTVGASAGDHVLYFLGRRFGSRMRDRAFVRRLGTARWDAAIQVVERRGAVAIVATRLVPVIRTLTPLAAGTAKIPLLRFTVASLVGSLTWALLWGGSGYLLQTSISAAEDALRNVTWIVGGALALLVAIVVVVRAAKRRRRSGARLVVWPSGRVIASWSSVALLLALVVSAVVTTGGTGLPDGVARTLGLLTTASAVAMVVATRSARAPWDVVLPSATIVVGLVATALHHGLPASLTTPPAVVLALWAAGGRRTRTGTAALLLAAVPVGVLLWPWAWTADFAAVGTVGSLSLFAAVVVGTVAAIRVWRDRALLPALSEVDLPLEDRAPSRG